VLGEGGMATVYRGFDEMLKVERAIKVLSPQMAESEKIRTRFLAEAQTMARLKHANIVGVYDVGMEGDTPFIVMEMIEGGAVMDWVHRNGPMSPLAAVWITIGVLRALALAHENGVIHRDVKPHNVLLTRKGVPKLTDFGIAQVNSNLMSLTRTGAVMGTMAYMSPEQRRDTKTAGVPSDIYATAASLYVMVTGQEPFDLYSTDLRDELFGDMQEELCTVIQTAASYRPDDRYQTAKEMEAALLAIVDALPPTSQVTADGRVILSSAKSSVRTAKGFTHSDSTIDGEQPSIEQDDAGTIDFDSLPGPANRKSTHKSESPPSGEKLNFTFVPLGVLFLVFAVVTVGLAWFANQESVPPAPSDINEADVTNNAPEMTREQAAAMLTEGNVEFLRKVVRDKRSEIQDCYQASLVENPGIAGRVVVALEILSGKVIAASIEENSTGDTALERCVIAKTKQWSFEENVSASVRLPFTLTPDSDADADAVPSAPSNTNEENIALDADEMTREQAVAMREKADSWFIKSVINDKKGEIQGCFEKSLLENPELSGRLAISVDIGNGEVVSVRIEENETGDKPLEDCVIAKAKQWSFESNITKSIHLPFALSSS